MWEFFRIEMLKILGTTDSRNPKGQTNNGHSWLRGTMSKLR